MKLFIVLVLSILVSVTSVVADTLWAESFPITYRYDTLCQCFPDTAYLWVSTGYTSPLDTPIIIHFEDNSMIAEPMFFKLLPHIWLAQFPIYNDTGLFLQQSFLIHIQIDTTSPSILTIGVPQ